MADRYRRARALQVSQWAYFFLICYQLVKLFIIINNILYNKLTDEPWISSYYYMYLVGNILIHQVSELNQTA